MNNITRDGLPDRLRALAEDEIKGISAVLSPGNSHDLLTAADEIERLRLTDAELKAVERQARSLERDAERSGMIGLQEMLLQDAATLRGLLNRNGATGSGERHERRI